MSDALAAIGYFSHAVLPRIPGRDFAGTVVDGPSHLTGKNVWGSGGAAGIDFNGSLAEFMVLPERAVSVAPSTMDSALAGAQPLPYITAYAGLVKRASIQAGETVYVSGALGQVGQAAMSICAWKGCKAIALVRGERSVELANARGWTAFDTTDDAFMDKLVAQHGKADVILNSIGNVVWTEYIQSLKEFGRLINIGARPGTRDVKLDLFNLYRANQTIIGVNSVSFDYTENAGILSELVPGFESGDLQPLQTSAEAIYTLENATVAFQMALNNTTNSRIVIAVSGEV